MGICIFPSLALLVSLFLTGLLLAAPLPFYLGDNNVVKLTSDTFRSVVEKATVRGFINVAGRNEY
jgi:hypothetical protein